MKQATVAIRVVISEEDKMNVQLQIFTRQIRQDSEA